MSEALVVIVLTLNDIARQMRSVFEGFTDPRKGKNTIYTLTDAALSAFSVFFMQSPSFLEYQRSLEQTHGNNNARTLFGVHEIPCDNQISCWSHRTQGGRAVFDYLFNALEPSGVVDNYRSVRGALLLALDGMECFSSTAIHCPHGSARQRANGSVNYFRSVLTPVLVKPVLDKVIALAPEFVQPRDGAAKQDCEINAG